MSNKTNSTADPVSSRINPNFFVIHIVHVFSSHSVGSVHLLVLKTLRLGTGFNTHLDVSGKLYLLSTSGNSPLGSLFF